jgi:hypothetical protein
MTRLRFTDLLTTPRRICCVCWPSTPSFTNRVQLGALEMDRVALLGTGSAPEPRGVLNQSGVTLLDHSANATSIGPQCTGPRL